MNASTYRRMTLSKLQGRKVKTVRKISRGDMIVPAGTILTIVGKRGGLVLESEPCQLCRVKVLLWNVDPEDIEIIKGFYQIGFEPLKPGKILK